MVELDGFDQAIRKAESEIGVVEDRVGLVHGGGYAEACLMEEGMAIPMPPGWSFVQAAATPELVVHLGHLAEIAAVAVHREQARGSAGRRNRNGGGIRRIAISTATTDKHDRRCRATLQQALCSHGRAQSHHRSPLAVHAVEADRT